MDNSIHLTKFTAVPYAKALEPPNGAAVIHRLQERKHLTIAAGILCADGIVMCADSEESDSIAKYDSQKIRSHNKRMLVAGSGMGPYIDMTFDKLRDYTNGGWPQDAPSARVVTEQVVTEVYENHIQKFFSADRIGMDLVVAIRCANNELALIGTCGSATYLRCTTEDGPLAGGTIAVGAGRPLFEYWARLFKLDQLTCEEASYLSLFIIREVKNNVPGCGGATYAVNMLRNDNATRHSTYGDESMLLGGFPVNAIELLHNCMDAKVDDGTFERKLGDFVSGLRSLRSGFKQLANGLDVVTPSISRTSRDQQ